MSLEYANQVLSHTKAVIKAVHFILDHRIGGPHVYVRTLANELRGTVDSVIATTGRGPVTEFACINLRRWYRPLYVLEIPINALWITLRFGMIDRPSLFHIHGAANIAPIIAAVLCRMPVVWQFHETVANHRLLARVGSWLVRHTKHRILTVANSSRTAFDQLDATVVAGAVDTSFWNPNAINITYSTYPKAVPYSLRLLAVANLNPLKGLDLLIDSLPMVGLSIELEIVGAKLDTHSDFAHSLKERANKITKAYPDIVINFLGSLAATAIRARLAACEVFVLPSRSEACPIALLEAMAMERPCVVTDVGDIRDMLPTVQYPFICAPDSPKNLASALREMGDLDLNERMRIGRENRVIVETRFTSLHLAENMFRCYKSLA